MSKATETQLSILHARVAESMTNALEQSDIATSLIERYKDLGLPHDIMKFLEDAATVNPSLLSAATKFLKDNNISCDASESSELSELEDRLKSKRQSVSTISVAEH